MDAFCAGVATREITPEPGAPLWGYSGRSGPATGRLDPLCAKAIVFRCSAAAVALVSVDLGRAPVEASCRRIRERVQRAGIAHVMIAATHTHHGPVMEVEAPYTQRIETAIGDSIEAASACAQPARMGVGCAEFDIAHNRRKLLGDGRCAMLWRNEKRLATAPVDREATIVKIVAESSGAPLAILVHYACHPVIMGPSNLEYSADYPGELTRIVREQSGCECVFLQGGCGDINPYLDKTPMDQGAVEAMRGEGRVCAEAVLGTLDGITPVTPERPSVAFNEMPVLVGTRWDFQDTGQAEVWGASHPALFEAYRSRITPDLTVPLTVLILNGDMALAGMPGELFASFQLALKAQSPVPHSLLVGYCNDYHAYFPTIRDAAAGGYGGTVGSYVGLGAGERLVTRACLEIGRLAGRLRPRCSPDDFVILDADQV